MASLLVIIFVSFAVPCVFIGIMCNAAVALCILLKPSLRTRTNAIIVSLALSSFIFLLFVVPFIMDSFLTNTWRYSMWYCHLTARLSFLLVGVTVNNIAFLGLYRYFCVVHRKKPCLRSRNCVVILVFLSWALPLGLQLLVTYTGWTKSLFIPPYGRCILAKNSLVSGRAYDSLVLIGLITPFCIALFSYGRIIIAVKSSARKVRSEPDASEHVCNGNADLVANHTEGQSTYADPTSMYTYTNNNTEYRINDPSSSQAPGTLQVPQNDRKRIGRRKRKKISHQEILLTKICAIMFVLFSVCYGPICLLTIVFANTAFPPDAYTTCTIVYWLGSCVNPIVYATLQTEMRMALMKVVGKLKCRGQRRVHNIEL